MLRDGALCCVPCLARPITDGATEALSEAALGALVAEFIGSAPQMERQLCPKILSLNKTGAYERHGVTYRHIENTPRGMKIRLIRWDRKFMRNRFILTECGGLKFAIRFDDQDRSIRTHAIVDL